LKHTFNAIVFAIGLVVAPVNAAQPQAFEEGMNALLEGNFAEAYCQWKPLAHKGHAEAQYNLGWLYANGNGLNVDQDEANRWWKAAAEQGHADAQFAIGLGLITGVNGLKKNAREAVTWFLQAARQGHRDSREILLRLNADPGIDLLAMEPGLMNESWFGQTGVVTSDVINVRDKPTTKSKVVARLKKGTEVRVLGQRGNWVQVVLPEGDESRLAWIYHSLVKPRES
jgi:uncharacterized protein YgiM (DUF1202 family)